MTEYNYFCRADDKEKDWYQQTRYRVFNVKVTKEEYNKITKIYSKLEFDKDENSSTGYTTAFKKMWDWLTQDEKQEYLDIPHFNAKWFKFITWIDVSQTTEEYTLEEVCKMLGKNIKIKK
jgi:hypothetical protein